MYDFGAVTNHTNQFTLPSKASIATFTAVTIGLMCELLQVGAQEFILDKIATNTNNGWAIKHGSSEIPMFETVNQGTSQQSLADTALTVDTTVHGLMLLWDGSNGDWYRDGVADGTPAHTILATTQASNLHVGGDTGTANGAAG